MPEEFVMVNEMVAVVTPLIRFPSAWSATEVFAPARLPKVPSLLAPNLLAKCPPPLTAEPVAPVVVEAGEVPVTQVSSQAATRAAELVAWRARKVREVDKIVFFMRLID